MATDLDETTASLPISAPRPLRFIRSIMKKLFHHAREHCAYYKKLGVRGEELQDFPIINRSILRANLPDLLAEPFEKLSLLSALEGRSIPTNAKTASEFRYSKDLVIEQTSGSSGVPLRIPKTNAERTQLSLAAWRYRIGYDPLIRPNIFLPLFHRTLDSPLPVTPFESSASSVRKFYFWLEANKVRWIHAPAGLLKYHAGVLNSLNVQLPAPSLQFAEVSGSRPDDDAIKLIRRVLGVRIINQYGTRESWTIGHSEELAAFCINSEAVHVELLDDADNPITACGKEGAVVITSKILRLLPLIRYKTGDRG